MLQLANRSVFVFLVSLVACDAPDGDDSSAEQSEFRDGDLQCLMPTAPTAGDTVVADVVPGELVLFQGHYYVVPGAAANWDALLADTDAVTALSIGDIVRVVRPAGNYHSKIIAADSQSNLRTLKQGTITPASWEDNVFVAAMRDCLDEVEREAQDCENITEDWNCCESLTVLYAGMCADNPFYDVPNNTGAIWAETCGPQPIEDDWLEDEEIDVGQMTCSFTGWTDGAMLADISNGFLRDCVLGGSTPVGCQTF